MERRHRKLLYNLLNGVFGLLLTAVGSATVYAHLWLQDFQSKPASELAATFSEDIAAQKELMTDVRLIGGIILIALLPLLLLSGKKYTEMCDNPEWEVKKGLVSGVVFVIIGIIGYVIFSSDLFLQSLSVTMMGFGTFIAGLDSIYLLIISERGSEKIPDNKEKQRHRQQGASYCSNCGVEVDSSDSFCSDCGAEL